jgi:hypothetical protein
MTDDYRVDCNPTLFREAPLMQSSRCAHFSVEIEEIIVPNAQVVLRIPIRRCALAERMILLISKSPEGREIARKMTIAGTGAVYSEAPDEDRQAAAVRVAFGPDMEAIHSPECTVQRCQESCTPSFRMLLAHFDLQDIAARETGEGCLEVPAATEEGSDSLPLHSDTGCGS